MRILIVDDNKQITTVLAAYAKREGYETVVAENGKIALELFNRQSFDIVLLDVMMPEIDGFEVCKTIRKTSMVPIIMVTAKGEDFDRIMGLDNGADDYIVKPFSPKEIMARIRAIMRRVNVASSNENSDKCSIENNTGSTSVVFDNLMVDITYCTVKIDNIAISLTRKELDLLWTFALNPGKVFSRENLLDSLWGHDYFGDPRTVDTHLKRLRSKLDSVPHPSWDIFTIWGTGYKLDYANS